MFELQIYWFGSWIHLVYLNAHPEYFPVEEHSLKVNGVIRGDELFSEKIEF